MLRTPFAAAAAGILVFAALTAKVHAQDMSITGERLVKVTAVAAVNEVHAGEWFLVGFRFEIAPHWHIYWVNPGDSGAPTVVDVKAPAEYEVGSALWPRPLNIPGEFTTYGYEDEVTLFVPVKAPDTLSAGEVTLAASVEWMVCRDECLLGGAAVSVSIKAAGQSAPPGGMAGVREVTFLDAAGRPARRSFRFDHDASLSAFDRVPRNLADVKDAKIERQDNRIVLSGPAGEASTIEFFPSATPGVAMRVVEQRIAEGRFHVVLDTMVSPNNTRGIPPHAAGVIGLGRAASGGGGQPPSYAFRVRLDTDGSMLKNDGRQG